MTDGERIGPDTLRLLSKYYGSLLRRAERLAETERAELSNAEAAAAAEFRRAVRAARLIYDAGGKVTREAIFDAREAEEPDLTPESMLQRWKRGKFNIRDIKAAALDQ